MSNEASNYLSERQQFYDFLKEQFSRLGEDAFSAWWHEQDQTTYELIEQALTDPAFGLQAHQLMPTTPWRIWALTMGRGSGKTFAASCGSHILARDLFPGGTGILVGATVKDVRDTMIEGDSGILATAPPNFVPHYNKHDNVLVWPNGSKAIIRTADNPEDIRGPTVNWAWADELVKWRSEKSWDNLNRCVRNLHENGTRIIVTTTPKKAKQWIRAIETLPGCVVSKASSLDNEFMDAAYLAAIQQEAAGGSARAREEIYGEWIEGDGELWTQASLDACRVSPTVSLEVMARSMDRRCLSVDPSSGKHDETGIVLLGKKAGRVYVLADFTSGGNINQWTDEVVQLARSYLQPGDPILLEVNMNAAAQNVLEQKDRNLKIIPVTATRSKWHRAEEAFAHFQAGNVAVWHTHPKLELQLREWEPEMKKSPDRGDALTQGVNYLCGTHGKGLSVPFFTLRGWAG